MVFEILSMFCKMESRPGAGCGGICIVRIHASKMLRECLGVALYAFVRHRSDPSLLLTLDGAHSPHPSSNCMVAALSHIGRH